MGHMHIGGVTTLLSHFNANLGKYSLARWLNLHSWYLHCKQDICA